MMENESKEEEGEAMMRKQCRNGAGMPEEHWTSPDKHGKQPAAESSESSESSVSNEKKWENEKNEKNENEENEKNEKNEKKWEWGKMRKWEK